MWNYRQDPAEIKGKAKSEDYRRGQVSRWNLKRGKSRTLACSGRVFFFEWNARSTLAFGHLGVVIRLILVASHALGTVQRFSCPPWKRLDALTWTRATAAVACRWCTPAAGPPPMIPPVLSVHDLLPRTSSTGHTGPFLGSAFEEFFGPAVRVAHSSKFKLYWY